MQFLPATGEGATTGSGFMGLGSLVGLTLALAGGALTGVADAQEAVGLRVAETANNWPWIASAAIVILLVAVSFVSRRRIHSVVGS
jgi:hypothetical protein